MSSHSDTRLDTRATSTYTGLSESHLEKLRVYGGGPPFLKLGRRVVYDRGDIDAWLSARRQARTAQAA